MITLSKRQVLMLHHDLLGSYGGASGVRDEGMLDST